MPTERLVLSISQLNAEVSQLLSQGFAAVWVEGEISNFTCASSGHLYLTLKDAGAQVRCALFKGNAMRLKLNPRNGLKVVARGKIGLYEPRGDYQMVLDTMEEAGEGALQRQFEALKQQLQAQGLFADTHKQALPSFPRAIGVVTSPTGAAIRDIINVLKRRCPQIPVLVYPVLVQGEGAKEQIAQAIAQADREQRCEVLIVARGGGSIEDLWAFNEEIVAQAIYQCSLPIISGVGHEIDFTIADFVADQRAPTPSAAAELVSPDMQALQQRVQQLKLQLWRFQQRQLQSAYQQVQQLSQRLNQQRPTQKLQQKAQRLDELDLRLNAAIQRRLQQQHLRLTHLQTRLQQRSPQRQLQQQHAQLERLQTRLQRALQQRMDKAHSRFVLQVSKLKTLSPLATLERGYSITQNAQGHVITQAAQVSVGETLITRVVQGQIESVVTKAKF
ncbi:MAG: exodeoxyribonuclease VII large subunit [Thiotrichaceae bacterium]